MHRNTLFFILILCILTTLVLTVNIRHITNGDTVSTLPTPTPKEQSAVSTNKTIPTETLTSTPFPTLPIITVKGKKQVTYDACGVIVTYPDTLQMEQSDGGIFFSASNSAAMPIVVACQKEIPRPSVPENQIETKTIDGISMKLYHSQAAKDGSTTDALIFTHPKNQLDVVVGGSGDIYKNIIGSLKIIK